MFDRGDLLLIPFPFADLSGSKKRPVLALTRADAYGDFIALAVTSRPQTDRGIPVTKSFGRASEAVISTALARLCAFVGHGGI